MLEQTPTSIKADQMSDEAFAELKGAMEDALAFERGKRHDLNTTRIQGLRPPKSLSPQPIARVRDASKQRARRQR